MTSDGQTVPELETEARQETGASRGNRPYNGPRIVNGTPVSGPSETTADMVPPTDGERLRDALLSILSLRGRDAFLSPGLAEELRAQGVSQADSFRVCLLSSVTGFPQLLDPRSGQYDLERFVAHALRETGLRKDIVLDLTGAFAVLSGLPFREWQAEDGGETLPSPLFPPTADFFREELDACRPAFQKGISHGTPVSQEMTARLQPLVSAGVPEARYLMGAWLLRRARAESVPSQEAMDLLEAAARDGDPHASAALADFYYERRQSGDWAEAYRRYTGYGALALDDRRRIALVDILNQKLVNQRLLRLSGSLLALLSVLAILTPAAPLYAVRWLWAVGFVAAGGGLLAAAHRRYQRACYEEQYALPVALLAVWTVYWMARVLL